MTNIYKCGNCDNEVKYGAKFCDECGTKLEWPKEKIRTVKKTKKPKKATGVRLPINPDNLYRLIEPEGSFIRNPIYNIVLFFFAIGGPILSIIMSNRQKKIHQWFNSLETEDGDLSVFQKYVNSMKNCGIWAIVLNIAWVLMNVIGLLILGPVEYLYISAPLTGGVGIAIGVYVVQLANKIIAETESNELYLYKFQEEPEEKTESSDKFAEEYESSNEYEDDDI